MGFELFFFSEVANLRGIKQKTGRSRKGVGVVCDLSAESNQYELEV